MLGGWEMGDGRGDVHSGEGDGVEGLDVMNDRVGRLGIEGEAD